MKRDKYTVYVHKVNTENGPMYYAGITSNLITRWKPSSYNGSALQNYVEKYGWDNIEHAVIVKDIDYDKAKDIEDQLILFYSSIGRKINRNRSGFSQKITQQNAYKITQRIREFNMAHPDKFVEMPLEGRRKYIKYGYIPDYIKNDDL